MRKQNLLMAMMLCSIGLFASGQTVLTTQTTQTNQTVNFKNDLNEAKRQAGREGKLYIVEFMTTHCYPCKMMDEITFANPQVVNYIEQNYIPAKVNVESFDGFVWKEKYDISVLPTIMIFNSKGETVAKYEESMGSSRMYNILSEHNHSGNRTATESYLRPAPEIPPLSPPVAQISTPALPASPPVVISTPMPVATQTNYTPPPSISSPPPVSNPIRNDATGFEFQVKRNTHSDYGVQIGAYAQYGNARRILEQLERQFSRHVMVSTHTIHGRVVYKVIVSGFGSRIDAADFQSQISTSSTDYFIVDLSKTL